MTDPRILKLADVLVNYSADVKPGQLVRISSPLPALPLANALYQRVIDANAHPLMRINCEDWAEYMVKHGSDDQLLYENPIALYEVEHIDRSIGIWAEENTRAMTNCDPTRLAMTQRGRKRVFETFMKRAAGKQLNWVGTQYPTQAVAQDAEMSLSEYAEFVFTAGLLHLPDPVAAWKQVSQRQQRLIDLLAGKTDYRVVAANGTDIRMNLANRSWVNCDGHENFPDGEVFTGPVESSVEGTIVFSFPAVHMGREVTGVRLTFKNGKVVDAHADKGLDFLIKMLDMDSGSRFLGECAIGTNYSIKNYTKNTLFDEKIGGTVHFALGAGYPETGNHNQSGLHWDMVVDLRQGGRIEIDGQTVSQDGKFLDPTFPSE
jgi:aminopeptidase